MASISKSIKSNTSRFAADLRHHGLIQNVLYKYEVSRDALKSVFLDWQSAQKAAEMKSKAGNYLDQYFESMVVKLEAQGRKVYGAISKCDALIAQTSSIIVTSCNSVGWALRVLPPHYVVLSRRDGFVRGTFPLDLHKHGRKCVPDYPSMISDVSRRSPTGILNACVFSAPTKPKKLTIICSNNN